MSLEAMTWAFKQELRPTRKIVLLALADYADDEYRCWPSMRTLADKSSLTERAVRNTIRELEEWGLVATEARSRPNGSQTSNVYVLTVPGAPAFRSAPPSPGTPPPEPPSNPHKNTPPTPSIDDAFEAVWKAWPNAKGKKPASIAWRRLTTHQQNEIVPSLVRHANAHRDHTPPQFIPMLSTWLNQERWDDPLPVSRDSGARKPEPTRAQPVAIPAGHRAVWSPEGYIIGSEPA